MKMAPSRAYYTSDSGGFSLLELLVVVAILGLVFAVAIPSMSRFFGVSIQSTTREIATTIRNAFNGAVVTGRVYRLVYDIDKGMYWVEMGPAGVLVDTEEAKKNRERFGRKKKDKDPSKAKSQGFDLAKAVTRKPISLPLGVAFDDVITPASSTPVAKGRAYTHFFPHGLAEQTLVHLKDSSGHRLSLIIQATSGQTEIANRYLSLEESLGEAPNGR